MTIQIVYIVTLFTSEKKQKRFNITETIHQGSNDKCNFNRLSRNSSLKSA